MYAEVSDQYMYAYSHSILPQFSHMDMHIARDVLFPFLFSFLPICTSLSLSWFLRFARLFVCLFSMVLFVLFVLLVMSVTSD